MVSLISVIEFFLLFAGLIITLPVLVFVVQVVSSLFFRGESPVPELTGELTIAVLVPAHNEEELIARTLKPLSGIGSRGHHLVVIADNCTDKTAEIAATYNVDVVIRNNQELKGKGYALDAGVEHLRKLGSSPDIVVIIDADCETTSADIESLAARSFSLSSPVQALYLMTNTPNPGIRQKIAEFAWRVKNLVRPLGYQVLGLPCQLMGAGMAFPWNTLVGVRLANASIVEDLKLGLDLAEDGTPAIFYSDARVISYFPDSEASEKSQRVRWEHGHLGMISHVPALLMKSIMHRNYGLFALVLDLSVPPLALLVISLILFFMVTLGFALITGLLHPLALSLLLLVMLVGSVFLAWSKYATDVISFSDLLFVPVYILKKIPVYVRFIYARERRWIRTSRK
jgi:cellulose synthase/poly-beta-1,6-N-acetylglucosamine synthase-like glycosyltransferase